MARVVGLAHDDVVIDVDLAALPGSLADWINDSFAASHSRRDGAWAEVDDSGRVLRAREFADAQIAEIRLPELDASSTEPASLEVRISPELVSDVPAPRPSAVPASPSRQWQSSAFKLVIDGMPTANVIKVDAIVIEQSVRGVFEASNLVVRFAAADAGPWMQWFDSFVIDGKCADSDELSGSITFLAGDQKTELGRVDLDHVGIVALSIDDMASGEAGVAVMKAELYVEDLKIFFDRQDDR